VDRPVLPPLSELGSHTGEDLRSPADHARPLRRRNRLPNGRAIAGGLLVIVAAVGVFAAFTGATGQPTTSWLVAKTTMGIGHRIVPADDLAPMPIALPVPMQPRVFAAKDAAVLSGAVTVAPIAAGELVEASDVVRAQGGGRLIANEQLSLALSVDRAVAGTLQAGERVDVLATYGAGTDACTIAVVRRALLLEAATQDSGVQGAGAVLVLGLDRPEQSAAVVDAMNNAKIVVVRTTAAEGETAGGGGVVSPSGDCYRALRVQGTADAPIETKADR
jgi:hypothetical protein